MCGESVEMAAAAAMEAGRQRKTDSVDLGCGLRVLVSVGDRVEAGEPVAPPVAPPAID